MIFFNQSNKKYIYIYSEWSFPCVKAGEKNIFSCWNRFLCACEPNLVLRFCCVWDKKQDVMDCASSLCFLELWPLAKITSVQEKENNPTGHRNTSRGRHGPAGGLSSVQHSLHYRGTKSRVSLFDTMWTLKLHAAINCNSPLALV